MTISHARANMPPTHPQLVRRNSLGHDRSYPAGLLSNLQRARWTQALIAQNKSVLRTRDGGDDADDGDDNDGVDDDDDADDNGDDDAYVDDDDDSGEDDGEDDDVDDDDANAGDGDADDVGDEMMREVRARRTSSILYIEKHYVFTWSREDRY